MLRLDGVCLEQGGFTLRADLTLAAGTRAAVVGPSGSGKSTLLAAIAGFLAPSRGRILWDGNDITDDPPGDRPLSILFQDHNLFPHLTAAQNVGLGLSPGLRLSAADRERVEDALSRTGLRGLGDRRPAQLSGGQQSRVALARALLRHRPLMLLDEPFSALGPGLKIEMLTLVAELAEAEALTVLIVTHDPRDALTFAPQTIFVDQGVAHPPRDTAALFADPPPALRAYLE